MVIDILVAVAYRGGVEEVINATGKYLKNRGHSIRIIHALWQGEAWADKNLNLYTLFDVTNGIWKGDMTPLVQAYASFMTDNGFPDGIICAGWPILIDLAKNALNTVKKSIPVFSWCHQNIEAYEKEGVGGFSELSRADGHFAINRKIAENLKTKSRAENVYCVRNPVNTERIVFCRDRDIHRLAYVGRLAPEKDLPFLLQTLSLMPPSFSLDIIGDADPEGLVLQSLKEYARSLGIEQRVTFHGWKKNPWELLTHTGALLLTSEREGYPLVLIEAMLCGMCVISTPTDGPMEMIRPGENGFIFPFGDHAFLIKLLRLLELGSIPTPDPETCRNTFSYVIDHKELYDFNQKLEALIRKEPLAEINEL